MGVESDIKGASLVSIDAGAGDTGFSVPNDKEGLTWNNTAFGGGLACNVTTQTTGLQLFWAKETGERKETSPKTCERVRLAPEYFWNVFCDGEKIRKSESQRRVGREKDNIDSKKRHMNFSHV